MEAPRVKKRITPTIVRAASPERKKEEDEDLGPKGPRRRHVAKIGADIKRGMKMKKYKHDNPWIHHVRLFADKNGMTYGCALSNPHIKEGYKAGQYTAEKHVPTVQMKRVGAKKKAKGEEAAVKKIIKKKYGGKFDFQEELKKVKDNMKPTIIYKECNCHKGTY